MTAISSDLSAQICKFASIKYHLCFSSSHWATVREEPCSFLVHGFHTTRTWLRFASQCFVVFIVFATLHLQRQRACSYSPGMSLYEGWVPSAPEGAAVIRWWENSLSFSTHLLSILDGLSGTRAMPGQVLLMSASLEEKMRRANTQLFVCTWWKRCGFPQMN